MTRIALLAAVALPLLFSRTSDAAQAQMRGHGGPCTVATPANLAAARLAPVETQALGPNGCTLIWSRSPARAIDISVRPLRVGGDEFAVGPGMCAKALSSPQKTPLGRKTRSCKELRGYGKFAVLITTDPDPRTSQFATILLFLTSQNRVQIVATGGIPGGDAAAVQRLGNVLAAKYR